MFSFGATAKERFFVIFDISSASIGACIAVRTGGSVKLAWHTRAMFGYQTEADFDRYVKTMYATLLEVGMRVSGEGAKQTKASFSDFSLTNATVHCVIGAPWFFGAVQTVEKNTEQPSKVTVEEIHTLLHQGASTVMHGKGRFESWKEIMGDSSILEARADSILLTGYPVRQFENRETKQLTVHAYYSIISTSVKKHIEEVVQKVFPNHTIHFTTSTHIFASTYMERREKVAFIEVSEEVTTVSIITQGVVQGTATYPAGVNHTLRRVAPKATSAEDAQKLLSATMPKKTNEDSTYDSFPEPLKVSLLEWHKGFVDALTSIAEGITPPSKTVILAEPSWYTLFQSALSGIPTSMPGVREDYTPLFTPFYCAKKKQVSKEEHTDFRLSTVALLYEGYTTEKGVCYTIE